MKTGSAWRWRRRAFGSPTIARAWSMLAPQAVAMLVVAAELNAEIASRLRALREKHPEIPLVLITRLEVRNLLKLAAVTVDTVADIHDDPTSWLNALAEAMGDPDSAARRELAGQLRAATHLPEWIRAGAVRLATREPPIRSVKALAQSRLLAEMSDAAPHRTLHLRMGRTG